MKTLDALRGVEHHLGGTRCAALAMTWKQESAGPYLRAQQKQNPSYAAVISRLTMRSRMYPAIDVSPVRVHFDSLGINFTELI